MDEFASDSTMDGESTLGNFCVMSCRPRLVRYSMASQESQQQCILDYYALFFASVHTTYHMNAIRWMPHSTYSPAPSSQTTTVHAHILQELYARHKRLMMLACSLACMPDPFARRFFKNAPSWVNGGASAHFSEPPSRCLLPKPPRILYN
jgi:hypothetical protein